MILIGLKSEAKSNRFVPTIHFLRKEKVPLVRWLRSNRLADATRSRLSSCIAWRHIGRGWSDAVWSSRLNFVRVADLFVATVIHAAYGTAGVASTVCYRTSPDSIATISVTCFTNIARAMNAIVHSSQNVWSPSLSASASCKSQQQAGRNQCRSFHFPNLPVELCCEHLQRCTFPRTTLRRDSGCASKDGKLFLIEKLFLTLCILFRCYSCSATDLLKWHKNCLPVSCSSAPLRKIVANAAL